MNITYSTDKKDLAGLDMGGFFEGWPQKPGADALARSIRNAGKIVLAIDADAHRLAGYITALTDGVLAAYIPFLEVETSYRHNGIGTTLVKKMLEQLSDLYMIDLVCDKEIASFYTEAGFEPGHAMVRRNYANQRGV